MTKGMHSSTVDEEINMREVAPKARSKFGDVFIFGKIGAITLSTCPNRPHRFRHRFERFKIATDDAERHPLRGES